MRKDQSANGCGGRHGECFGKVHAKVAGMKQIKKRTLFGMIRTGRIAMRHADAGKIEN